MLAIVQKDYLINLHLELMRKSCIYTPSLLGSHQTNLWQRQRIHYCCY